MQASGSSNGTDHISTSAMQVTASALKRDASPTRIRALLVPQLRGEKAARFFSLLISSAVRGTIRLQRYQQWDQNALVMKEE